MRFQYVIHGDEAYMFNGDERQANEKCIWKIRKFGRNWPGLILDQFYVVFVDLGCQLLHKYLQIMHVKNKPQQQVTIAISYSSNERTIKRLKIKKYIYYNLWSIDMDTQYDIDFDTNFNKLEDTFFKISFEYPN